LILLADGHCVYADGLPATPQLEEPTFTLDEVTVMARPDDREELARSEWHDALEELSAARQGDEVTIEVLDREFGDVHEAERIPLAYVEYDHKDDAVTVAVGGFTARYPVVLRHFVPHPRAIYVHPPQPEEAQALDLVDGEGVQTLVTLHPKAG
jgi:hypothetical protein